MIVITVCGRNRIYGVPCIQVRHEEMAAFMACAHTKFTGQVGVGFAAIDHLARPRIPPASDDVLEVGMVFNVESAAHFEGQGGLRHCSMVKVTRHGAEALTPFQATLDDPVRTP